MKVTPIADRILVRLWQAEEMTEEGLFIPSVAQETPSAGTVESVGEDVKWIKSGMEVLFAPYSGTEVGVKDMRDYKLLREEEILGIITKDDGD